MENPLLLTQAQAAEIIGVTPATIISWRRDGVQIPYDETARRYPARELGVWIREEMPFIGDGRYMPDKERLRRHLGMKSALPSLPGLELEDVPESKEEAERRLAVAKADKQEMDNAVRAGTLVDVETVTHAWVDILSRVKAKLLRMPSALAPLVYGKPDAYAIQSVLEDGVREALEELAEDWRGDFVETETDDARETP